ncbi:MAG TPA: sugar ABC transporter substrate-binding protein [Solirubrobacterales bacterium]|jgi:ribose transport system substrate-binding protein|nr:sugar ABC transporter substrate-binding protein [Solirubrobacterales bacterium]
MARRSRFGLLAFACLVLALVVAACGGGSSSSSGSSEGGVSEATAESQGSESQESESTGEKAEIAFFGLAAANAYTQAAWEAAKAEAEKEGASIRFFDGEFNGSVQFKQIQDAIASGQYNGFDIMPNDGSGLVPVAEEAIQAGIKVASLEFALGSDPTSLEPQVEGLTTTVGYNITDGAEAVSNEVVKECEGKDPCEVALMYGELSTQFDQIRQKTTKEILDKHSNIDVVSETEGGFLREGGAKATQDVLAAHPDVEVIASPSADQEVLGAMQVLEHDGKTGVALIGTGGANAAVEAVREGKYTATFVQLPATEGRLATQYLIEAIDGKEVPDEVNLAGKAPVGALFTVETSKKAPNWKAEWEG